MLIVIKEALSKYLFASSSEGITRFVPRAKHPLGPLLFFQKLAPIFLARLIAPLRFWRVLEWSDCFHRTLCIAAEFGLYHHPAAFFQNATGARRIVSTGSVLIFGVKASLDKYIDVL